MKTVHRFTIDDFAIVMQREFGRVIRMKLQRAVRLVSVKPGESMPLHDSSVMPAERICTHTSPSFRSILYCASRIETHPVYNRTRASLPLQTLMHRLSSCTYTTPRRRRQGETIAFVSTRLPFTPCFPSAMFGFFLPQ